MTLSLTFPGQGSQAIGMGKALADAYPEAKAVFDEVDEALGESLSSLIWEGTPEELTLTPVSYTHLTLPTIYSV